MMRWEVAAGPVSLQGPGERFYRKAETDGRNRQRVIASGREVAFHASLLAKDFAVCCALGCCKLRSSGQGL